MKMTKKEFLERPAFKRAKDDAQVWIQMPDCDDCIPCGAWVLPFADGTQNLIIQTREPDDPWKTARLAAKALNRMGLGIEFYGNLFPYLRKRGKLDGLCQLKRHGKRPEWHYDTEGIAVLVKAGKLDYKPRD